MTAVNANNVNRKLYEQDGTEVEVESASEVWARHYSTRVSLTKPRLVRTTQLELDYTL